jgi:hypothetical protein
MRNQVAQAGRGAQARPERFVDDTVCRQGREDLSDRLADAPSLVGQPECVARAIDSCRARNGSA